MKVKSAVYRELIKTDKHGNQTFRTNRCKKCGGTGNVGYTLDNGRCWTCGGTGCVLEYKTVVYTPEQEALRNAKRTAKRLGTVAQQLAAKGYGASGIGYIPTGDTFNVRAEISALGGYWDFPRRRWIMPVAPDFCEYKTENAWDFAHVDHNSVQGVEWDAVVWHYHD